MKYSWIATSSYNTALQRMLYFVLAKTIEERVFHIAKIQIYHFLPLILAPSLSNRTSNDETWEPVEWVTEQVAEAMGYTP